MRLTAICGISTNKDERIFIYHSMKMIVDIQKIVRNAESIKRMAGCELCAVIKADAYGHGAVKVAHVLKRVAKCFAVATYSEAKELCDGGITSDIIILGADCTDGESNLIPTAVSRADCERKSKYKRWNLALDTGMHRLGVTDKDLHKITKNGKIFSVFSHIRSKESIIEQSNRFDEMCSVLNVDCLKHLYAGNFRFADRVYDMVRPGLQLFGYGAQDLEPAMKVYAEIVRSEWVKQGECVGYGNEKLDHSAQISTVKMGYRDGFPRIRKGKERCVWVNGISCPIVGQVCMDMFMVDTSLARAKEGDWAEIVGPDVSAQDLADQFDTISYEVLTAFRHREDIIYENG